jgi:cystathionine beta-synthase
VFVAGAGTGGTLSGTARRLKELLPNIIIVGVDPFGSILAQPETLNASKITGYEIEGIGYDFVPGICDRSLVDLWVKTSDKESFIMARRLIREEGLLVGGSCGTAMVGALMAIKQLGLKKDARVCVILPDSVRNYMSKFLNDDWMKKRGFLADEPKPVSKFLGATIKDLNLQNAITIPAAVSIKNAIDIMKTNSFDQLPVTSSSDSKHVVGLITLGGLLAKLASNRIKMDDSAEQAMYHFKKEKKFTETTVDTPLEKLTKFFETNSSAVVTKRSDLGELLIVGIVTKVDLLTYLISKNL